MDLKSNDLGVGQYLLSIPGLQARIQEEIANYLLAYFCTQQPNIYIAQRPKYMLKYFIGSSSVQL